MGVRRPISWRAPVSQPSGRPRRSRLRARPRGTDVTRPYGFPRARRAVRSGRVQEAARPVAAAPGVVAPETGVDVVVDERRVVGGQEDLGQGRVLGVLGAQQRGQHRRTGLLPAVASRGAGGLRPGGEGAVRCRDRGPVPGVGDGEGPVGVGDGGVGDAVGVDGGRVVVAQGLRAARSSPTEPPYDTARARPRTPDGDDGAGRTGRVGGRRPWRAGGIVRGHAVVRGRPASAVSRPVAGPDGARPALDPCRLVRSRGFSSPLPRPGRRSGCRGASCCPARTCRVPRRCRRSGGARSACGGRPARRVPWS